MDDKATGSGQSGTDGERNVTPPEGRVEPAERSAMAAEQAVTRVERRATPETRRMTPAERVLIVVGAVGPLGYLPASGTVTVAVVGIPLFWLMHTWSPGVYVATVLAFTAASVRLHSVGDRILGEKDSRRLVWDELVGFMFAVMFVPFTWQLAVLLFFVERGIDIVKVSPARWIEKRWPGGWGVVGDDVVAGLYTCAIAHVLMRVMPGVVGVGA
ncbi:MAG: phosphatidylglycerophosphatase A [Phycisphaerae bacterium]